MPLTGTESTLAASMYSLIIAELGQLPNPESAKQLKALCKGMANAIVPHITLNAQVSPGIPTAGGPTAQATISAGTLM